MLTARLQAALRVRCGTEGRPFRLLPSHAHPVCALAGLVHVDRETDAAREHSGTPLPRAHDLCGGVVVSWSPVPVCATTCRVHIGCPHARSLTPPPSLSSASVCSRWSLNRCASTRTTSAWRPTVSTKCAPIYCAHGTMLELCGSGRGVSVRTRPRSPLGSLPLGSVRFAQSAHLRRALRHRCAHHWLIPAVPRAPRTGSGLHASRLAAGYKASESVCTRCLTLAVCVCVLVVRRSA